MRWTLIEMTKHTVNGRAPPHSYIPINRVCAIKTISFFLSSNSKKHALQFTLRDMRSKKIHQSRIQAVIGFQSDLPAIQSQQITNSRISSPRSGSCKKHTALNFFRTSPIFSGGNPCSMILLTNAANCTSCHPSSSESST